MEIQVLGPLAGSIGGVSFIPSASKSRQVLALLVLNANRIVSISALQRELWRDNPPQSALTTLQTYILQIRKLLTHALDPAGPIKAKDLLVTNLNGYTFHLEPGRLDIDVYRSFVARGQAALTVNDCQRASEILGRALRMWRGAALDEVHLGPLLEIQAMRLEESRAAALELRIDADLRLGRHNQVVSELIALTAEHRFNESLHGQLMTALHRSGRRAEALSLYHRLRISFIEELGLEPSPRLQQLQRAVLVCDPALDEEGTMWSSYAVSRPTR